MKTSVIISVLYLLLYLYVSSPSAAPSWLDSSVGREHCTGIALVMGSNPVQA